MRLTILAILLSLCTAGAALAQEPEFATHDENTDPNLAPEAKWDRRTRTQLKPQALARWNRLAINLSYGFGSAALDDVHTIADYYSDAYDDAINPGVKDFDHDAIKGNLQHNAEIGFTYYAPYYILAHVAFGAIYQKSTATVLTQAYENWNLMFEIPILLGGYYPFKHRFYAYGAIGPVIHTYGHSWWDLDGPGIPDATAGTGVGMQVMLGMDIMISDPFSLGLALKYRYQKTDTLVEKNAGTAYPWVTNKKPNPPTDSILDFSGISLEIIMRFWVL